MRLLFSSILMGVMGGLSQAQGPPPQIAIDTPYLTSPPHVVEAMLKLARVGSGDTVYDLGCGDGRIVISAATRYGARGVGIDNNPVRIDEARVNARNAGVVDRVNFELNDLFDADIRNATVVAVYLLPDVNLRLRSRLMRELKPGTRIVSHTFDMGDWKPERELNLDRPEQERSYLSRRLMLWIVPSTPRETKP